MKVLIMWVLATFVFVGFFISSFAGETIRITTEKWEPYVSKSLKHYGIAARIVTDVFASEDVKVTYGFFPWLRGFELAKSGEWDGTFPYYFKDKRTKYFFYSDPLFDGVVVFFHLKSFLFDWETYDDLNKVEIGATIGYTYGKEFDEAEKTKKISVERVPLDDQNFRKLLEKRINLFPFDVEVGYYTINNLFKNKAQLFTHHPKPVNSLPLHLILSKKVERNKRLLMLFNQGLKRLKASEKYDQYFEESRRGKYIIRK